uniref:Uncharacterized protein n=1 Tax=Arundo donax TaxID=35708 RepID=A0A0A8ZQV0_ARUDO
MQVQALVKSS